MEVRPIDANRLAEEIASMHAAGYGTWSTKGLLDLLCRQPTLTLPDRETAKACMSLYEKAGKRLERALDDLNGLCWCYIHGNKWEKAPDWSSLTFCEHLGGSIAAAGNAKRKCEHWQWRGQKED